MFLFRIELPLFLSLTQFPPPATFAASIAEPSGIPFHEAVSVPQGVQYSHIPEYGCLNSQLPEDSIVLYRSNLLYQEKAPLLAKALVLISTIIPFPQSVQTNLPISTDTMLFLSLLVYIVKHYSRFYWYAR